jgi:hypothetical protein
MPCFVTIEETEVSPMILQKTAPPALWNLIARWIEAEEFEDRYPSVGDLATTLQYDPAEDWTSGKLTLRAEWNGHSVSFYADNDEDCEVEFAEE